MSQVYEKNFRRIARDCGKLSVDSYNRYLKKRLTEVGSVTVAHERAILVSLWRSLYEDGTVEAMPRGLVKIKAVRPPTRAWTLDQCCTAVKGTFQYDPKKLRGGASIGIFLRCWLLLGYESGLRQDDIWTLRGSDFSGSTLQRTQAKTGNPIAKSLTPACMRAVKEMLAQSPDGRVLGWAMTKGGGRRRMKRYLKSLHLDGTGKWLRRSGATHIEMAHPGKGRLHLGHATVGLAEKFYIDWSQEIGRAHV